MGLCVEGRGYGVVSVGCGLLKTSQTLLQKFGVGDEEDRADGEVLYSLNFTVITCTVNCLRSVTFLSDCTKAPRRLELEMIKVIP